MPQLRSLEKQSLDALVQQVLAKVGSNARVLGPNAPLSPLDDRYIAPLKTLIREAIPGVPDSLLTSMRDDLIVVQRSLPEPSELVGFEPSILRVVKSRSGNVEAWQETYGDLLNVSIIPSRFLETDLKDCALTFSEQFFAPRSIQGWMKLSRHFSRVTAALSELAQISSLKQKDVFYDDRDSHFIYTNLVSAQGDPLELTPV